MSSITSYDAEGHITLTTAAPGQVGGARMATRTTYDALGRRTSVTTNYVSGGPTDDVTNMTTTDVYDALGHLVSETDPAGVVTRSVWDRGGRLTDVYQNSVSGQPGSASVNVHSGYSYNANGELTAYCPPVAELAGSCSAGSWGYARDAWGNVSGQAPPSGTSLGTQTAAYDALGRLASSFDGLHRQSYQYDAANNVTQIAASGGGAPAVTFTYGYDAASRRTSASNGTDSLAFGYDALGRLTAIQRAGATISGATYNPDGTQATSVQAAGTATFTYDGLSRLASAAMPSLFSGTATFTWRPDGLLGARSWPAGTTESFAYDAAKRPSALTVARADATTLATLTTAFDRVGNVTAESQVIAGATGVAGNSTITLSNDPLRRVTGYTLTSGGASTSIAYSYDADSNRLTAGATSFAYNGADQLASRTDGSGTRSAAYDAAGNLLSSPATAGSNSTFTYSATNRPLTAAAPGQSTVSYAYDALDRRATRTAGTASETYTYVGPGGAVGRVDRGGGQVTDSAVDAMGDRLTVGAAWVVPNVRGDVAALLAPDGASVTDAYRYDPFGATLATLGSSANPWRFQGRLLEPASGQYDLGARQYDPALAAFTGIDTVLGRAADPVSLNRYLYAHANPESMVDPDGHDGSHLDDGAAVRAAERGLAAAAANLLLKTAAVLGATVRLLRAGGRLLAAEAQAAGTCPRDTAARCDSWHKSMTAAVTRAQGAVRTALTGLAAALRDEAAALRALSAAEARLARAVRTAGMLKADATAAGRSGGLSLPDPRVAAGLVVLGALGVATCVLGGCAAAAAAITGSALFAGAAELAIAACTRLCPGGNQAAEEEGGLIAGARASVASAAESVLSRGPIPLTPNQAAAAGRFPGLTRAFNGFNFHQAVAEELQGAFAYSYRGPDFTELATGVQIELTTAGEVASHLIRYPLLTEQQIVTYAIR